MTDTTLQENIPTQLNEVDFLEPNLEGSELRIAIVQARFNENIYYFDFCFLFFRGFRSDYA